MCEPHGSIVQYPRFDEDERPVETIIQAAVETQRLILPEAERHILIPNGAMIGRFIHYSRMGRGHSETINAILGRKNYRPARLPVQDTKYETQWWDRRFRLDGSFHGQSFDQEDAYDSAKVYAERVVLGNVRLLRRFLELSITHSDVPYIYFEQAKHMLTHKAWLLFEDKLRFILERKDASIESLSVKAPRLVKAATDALIGLTRKRINMVPEWADVESVWN